MKLKRTHIIAIIASVILLIIGVLSRLYNTSSDQSPPLTQNPIIDLPKIRPDEVTTQKIIIDWNNQDFQAPKELTVYKISKPFIDQPQTLNIANYFGFTNQNEIDTKRSDSYLWVNNTKSLSATTPNGPLTYLNQTVVPTKLIKDPQALKTIVNQKISPLININELGLTQNDNVIFSKIDPKSLELTEATITNGTLGFISYQQSINNYPVILPTANNAFIRVTSDIDGNIRFLEITGGFSQVEKLSTINPSSIEELKGHAPNIAQRLTTMNDIEDETDYLGQTSISLKVTGIDIVYTSKVNSDTLIPVYRLRCLITNGKLAGQNIEYVIPLTIQ